MVNNEMYHVVFRAVGDAQIFIDKDDHYRGLFSIYEFNNKNFVSIYKRRLQRIKEKARRGPTPSDLDNRDVFVEILCFCFMPNHIHLLLKQVKENGISQFMQKVGTGYASYFNKKYKRKGHLFNKFKAIHIKTNDQLKNVFVYIHCNPLSLIEPGWKERGVKNYKKAVNFLEKEYKWSSYFDYIGIKNFPSVTYREFLTNVMGDEMRCSEIVKSWIKHKKEMKDFGNVALE